MKHCSSLSYSTLALVTTLAVIGCSPLSKFRTVGPRDPEPSASPIPTSSQSQSKLIASAPQGVAFLSGDIQFVAVEFKKKNPRLGYELEIRYPRINKPRTQSERNFNVYARRLIDDQIKNFEVFCSKSMTSPNGRRRRVGYYFSTDFQTLYATPEVLSINVSIQSYTGHLNADWEPLPINYDLVLQLYLNQLAG